MNVSCNDEHIIDQCLSDCNKKMYLNFAVKVEEFTHMFQCLCSNNFSEANNSMNKNQCVSNNSIICVRSYNAPLIVYRLDKDKSIKIHIFN